MIGFKFYAAIFIVLVPIFFLVFIGFNVNEEWKSVSYCEESYTDCIDVINCIEKIGDSLILDIDSIISKKASACLIKKELERYKNE